MQESVCLPLKNKKQKRKDLDGTWQEGRCLLSDSATNKSANTLSRFFRFHSLQVHPDFQRLARSADLTQLSALLLSCSWFHSPLSLIRVNETVCLLLSVADVSTSSLLLAWASTKSAVYNIFLYLRKARNYTLEIEIQGYLPIKPRRDRKNMFWQREVKGCNRLISRLQSIRFDQLFDWQSSTQTHLKVKSKHVTFVQIMLPKTTNVRSIGFGTVFYNVHPRSGIMNLQAQTPKLTNSKMTADPDNIIDSTGDEPILAMRN